MRPVCKICGVNLVEQRGFLASGDRRWKSKCCSCRRKPYTRSKKDICEVCGFIPVNRVQLDVDHIDGNSKNNDPNNLQTLCANCHRLKTYVNADWKEKDSLSPKSSQMKLDL